MKRGPDELREIGLRQRRTIQPVNGEPHVCVGTTNGMDVWVRALAEKDGLAVHRGFATRESSPCGCPEIEGYHIAHIASGFAILCLATERDAVAAMQRLAPLTNWTVTGEEVHRMPDEHLAAVKVVIADIQGRGRVAHLVREMGSDVVEVEP